MEEEVSERKGDWSQTYTGRQFWPLDPRPEDVCLEDVAHHLSNICRFGGACGMFYSVAQHAVLVSTVAERRAIQACVPPSDVQRLALHGLHHDDAEAYIGDMVRPLKRFIPQFVEIEDAIVERAIAPHFGLESWLMKSAVIKAADEILLATEARDLMGGQSAGKWALRAEPMQEHIVPVSSVEAYTMFMSRHRELGGRQ
jgi:5'-deoxynucleotidase YfbR-like HD superfamily hydrolase